MKIKLTIPSKILTHITKPVNIIAVWLFSCVLFSTSLCSVLCRLRKITELQMYWLSANYACLLLCVCVCVCVLCINTFFCKQAAYNYLKIVSSCAPILPTWSELDCLILMHKTDCLVCVWADGNSLHITNEKVVFSPDSRSSTIAQLSLRMDEEWVYD